MALKTVFDFIESPLVAWAKSILDIDSNKSLNYDLFTNGEYFYRMLKRIDSHFEMLHLPNQTVIDTDSNVRSRLENLDYLMRNIKSFYRVRFCWNSINIYYIILFLNYLYSSRKCLVKFCCLKCQTFIK